MCIKLEISKGMDRAQTVQDIQRNILTILEQYADMIECGVSDITIDLAYIPDDARFEFLLYASPPYQGEDGYFSLSIEADSLEGVVIGCRLKLNQIKEERKIITSDSMRELLENVTAFVHNSELCTSIDPIIISCPFCKYDSIKIAGTPHGEDIYVHKLKRFDSDKNKGVVLTEEFLHEYCTKSDN